MDENLFPPKAIQVHIRTSELEIVWQNDARASIPFQDLRRHCACSSCRAKKIVGLPIDANGSRIDRIELIGSSGIQIQFADGHQRGIYPWPFLLAFTEGRVESFLNG